jgi:hypothetical protein
MLPAPAPAAVTSSGNSAFHPLLQRDLAGSMLVLPPVGVTSPPSSFFAFDSSLAWENHSLMHSIPVTPAMPPAFCFSRHSELSHWLPVVYHGFPIPLIESFRLHLAEEGFLTVGDLLVAMDMAQLSLNYLAGFGFKIGHYNRLITHLKQIV